MNVQKLFAIEFFISIGISSWGAIKQGYMPWPPNIVGAAVAMGILSLTEAISPELSVLLGAGFILALIVATAETTALRSRKRSPRFRRTSAMMY